MLQDYNMNIKNLIINRALSEEAIVPGKSTAPNETSPLDALPKREAISKVYNNPQEIENALTEVSKNNEKGIKFHMFTVDGKGFKVYVEKPLFVNDAKKIIAKIGNNRDSEIIKSEIKELYIKTSADGKLEYIQGKLLNLAWFGFFNFLNVLGPHK